MIDKKRGDIVRNNVIKYNYSIELQISRTISLNSNLIKIVNT